MGKMQRIKGKVFERRIARRFRERFPEIATDIRRSIQSRGAEESDVVCPGLWLECQDAREVDPVGKLAQAIRDHTDDTIPIAITHKIRAKTIQVTMATTTYLVLLSGGSPLLARHSFLNMRPGLVPSDEWSKCGEIPLTIDFEDFLDILQHARPWASRGVT